MMKRYFSIALLALLAACGSASDGTSFQPPAGYVQKMKVGPFMEAWDKGTSLVFLMSIPVKSDLHKAMQSKQFENMHLTEKDMTICNGQPAIYAEGVGAYSQSSTEPSSPKGRVEMIMTDVGSKMYTAMYRRDINAPADPAAEAAIKNICPKA